MDKKREQDLFLQQIHRKEFRKLKAKQMDNFPIWKHIGTLGLIGWAVSLPAVIGVSIGWFIDKKLSLGHGWTLSLLIVGFLIGCWNACFWVCKEFKEINGDQKEGHE